MTITPLPTIEPMRTPRSQKELRAQIGQHLDVLNFAGAGVYGITVWKPAYKEHPAVGRPATIELDADGVLLKVNGKGISVPTTTTEPLPLTIAVCVRHRRGGVARA